MSKEKQREREEINTGLEDLAAYRAENPKLDKKVKQFFQENPRATARHLVERGYDELLIKANRNMPLIRRAYGVAHPINRCARYRFTKRIERDEIRSGVIEIIASRLSMKDPSIISLDDILVRDYGAETLDLIEIQMDIEEKYGIEIPWEEVGETMDNVGGIVHYVEKMVKREVERSKKSKSRCNSRSKIDNIPSHSRSIRGRCLRNCGKILEFISLLILELL